MITTYGKHDDLLKAFIEDEQEEFFKDEEPSFFAPKRVQDRKKNDTPFPKVAAGKYIYKDNALTVAYNKLSFFDKGKILSKKNRLIFLASLLKKPIRIETNENVCRIQIQSISKEERDFVLGFIRNGFSIKVGE